MSAARPVIASAHDGDSVRRPRHQDPAGRYALAFWELDRGGPVDLPAVERALTLAKEFGKPVVVHVVTQKGRGYAPAVNDEIEQIHSPGPFRADTGELLARRTGTWTSVFLR